MGKKRIANLSEEKKSGSPDVISRRLVKLGKQHGHIADVGAEALKEAEIIEKKEKQLAKEIVKETKETKKETKPVKVRSQKYLQAKKEIDKNKFYPLSESIKLLKKISISHFNGGVDVHLNVNETGFKSEVEFPYSTGKTQVVKIADEDLIKELEKGKINFSLLLASPKMMLQLVKFAKLLGPKGLMPNPKSGTISDNPEEAAKKLTQKTQFRTETKAPLIHLSIGKVNDTEKNLEANFKTLIKAVGKRNIKKAVLAPTMGPGVKIDLTSV
jgi:large subunit ribosomal protein L1